MTDRLMFITIVMPSAVAVVLLPCTEAPKVHVTIIAGPVVGGVLLVLLKSTVMRKPSRTTITIRHDIVVVWRKERVVRHKRALNLYTVHIHVPK
jgi:hypothetical protein